MCRFLQIPSNDSRYDGYNHWMGKYETPSNGSDDTDQDKGSVPKRQKRGNCTYCREKGKLNAKTPFFCDKYKVPLHFECFKPFHVK